MASKAKSRTLTDHEEIRRWAEARDAKPSAVRTTHTEEGSGIIRLNFPGYSGEDSLEEISWDEWFEDFDRRNLALIVQDETANGEQSNFNKLVGRDNAEGKKSSGRKSAGASNRVGAKAKSSRETSSATPKRSQSKSGGRSGRSRKKAA